MNLIYFLFYNTEVAVTMETGISHTPIEHCKLCNQSSLALNFADYVCLTCSIFMLFSHIYTVMVEMLRYKFQQKN